MTGGHCEHCMDGCVASEASDHANSGGGWSAAWDDGNCPMCAAVKAERDRTLKTIAAEYAQYDNGTVLVVDGLPEDAYRAGLQCALKVARGEHLEEK